MKTRIRSYYGLLLVEDRTVGLTMDEARDDLDRAFNRLQNLSLN